eukprot:1454504-Pyramimonas_sp.AAC.1
MGLDEPPRPPGRGIPRPPSRRSTRRPETSGSRPADRSPNRGLVQAQVIRGADRVEVGAHGAALIKPADLGDQLGWARPAPPAA